jgi:membrane-anchored protein YejM (alkaline phosphatase superfamily)
MKQQKRAGIILGVGIIAIILTAAYFKVTQPAPRPPNIVLISIDTLRGDYFSPERMPQTYSWAKENCAIFTNAYSNSTWTSPSHATMLSGFLQSQHKMEYSDSILAPEVPMIQEELQRAGYETLAYTGGVYVSKECGFDRGFDLFKEYSLFFDPEKKKQTFGELRDNCWLPFTNAQQLVTSAKSSKPVFLFVHSYLVHEYLLFQESRDAYPDVDRNELNTRFIFEESAEVKRRCYKAAVQEADKRLHEFIMALLHSPLAPNLAIILTSDHGEGLGDQHGDYRSFAHAHAPYSDQIHIPLAIYGVRKGQYDNLVAIKDIPRIIRELAGLEEGEEIPKNDFVLSEYIQYNSSLPPEPRTLAVTFPHKRILLTKDGKLSLFTDKGDTVNVFESGFTQMKIDFSAEMKENLKALGYLK